MTPNNMLCVMCRCTELYKFGIFYLVLPDVNIFHESMKTTHLQKGFIDECDPDVKRKK